MAIQIKNTYSGRTDNTDTNYPYGKGRNVVGGVEGTGTPFEAQWYNNLEGFLQGLLLEAGVTPDGQVDNANSSQLVEAVKGLGKSASKVVTSDGRNVQERLDDLPSEVDAAGTAEGLIDVHNSDASAHPELSAVITSEADRAETAADAAALSGNVFSNTSDGITSGLLYFSVVSPNDDNYLDLYKNESDVAVFKKSYPTPDGVKIVATEAANEAASDLFKVDSVNTFPNANLPVILYTSSTTPSQQSDGVGQLAVAGGLQLLFNAATSSNYAYFVGQAFDNYLDSKITWNYTGLVQDTILGNVGAGYLNSGGIHKGYTLAQNGTFYRFTGSMGVSDRDKVTGGLTGYGTGDDVKYIVTPNEKIEVYVNDSLVHSELLDEGEFSELIFAAQSGDITSVFSLSAFSDPVREYVTGITDPLSSDLESKLDQQDAENLFFEQSIDLYPAANLPVRRYVSDTTFNDYANGTYQTAETDGLSVLIPQSGSSLITHYLRTGKMLGEDSFSQRFELTGDNISGTSFGIGWINSSGDYVKYYYDHLGSPRKSVNYDRDRVFYALGLPTAVLAGDTVEITVKNNTITFNVNGTDVYSRELDEGDFDGEIVISQKGFNNGFITKTVTESDPIRDYFDNAVSSDYDMYAEVNADSKLTVYARQTKGRWVGYPIERVVKADINYDCWSFINADEFSFNGAGFNSTGRFPSKIVSVGVQESPWREAGGGDDFISGTAHGNEVTQRLILQIDGKIVDATAESGLFPCSSVRFIVESIVYSNKNNGTPLITRKRVYDFSLSGFNLDIQNTFIASEEFTIMYHTALAHPAGLFTTYYLDKELEVKPVAEVVNIGDFREYTMLGDGVSVRVNVLDIEAGSFTPRFLIAGNTGKPYLDLMNGGSRTFSIGEEVRIKSSYNITTF